MHPGAGRLLFGICQGGFDAAERTQSAREIAALDFDGVAVGGLSVGEPVEVMEAMTALSVAELPHDRPRYFMGLGTDRELLAMVALGIDMFDCVAPTRLARTGAAMTPGGRLALRRAAYRDDLRPLVRGVSLRRLRPLLAGLSPPPHRRRRDPRSPPAQHPQHHPRGPPDGRAPVMAIAAGAFERFRAETEARLRGGDDVEASADTSAGAPARNERRAGAARIPGTLGRRG